METLEQPVLGGLYVLHDPGLPERGVKIGAVWSSPIARRLRDHRCSWPWLEIAFEVVVVAGDPVWVRESDHAAGHDIGYVEWYIHSALVPWRWEGTTEWYRPEIQSLSQAAGGWAPFLSGLALGTAVIVDGHWTTTACADPPRSTPTPGSP